MNKRVKVLSLLCAAALAAGALAGCSSDGSTDGGTASGTTGGTAGGSSSKGTEISFMTWESEAMNEKILASFQAFESSHEGVTVKLTPSPLNDYGTKIKSMISSRTAPDVFMVGNDWVIQYGSSGNLYDWTAKAEADGIESLYYPGVVDNWKVDGKLYGFPGLLNTYGVFYSKKALDDAGLEYPKDGWSLEQCLEYAEKLTKDEGGNHTYGLYANSKFDPFFVSIYAASAGDTPYASPIKDVQGVTASPAFKKAVGMIGEAIQKKYVTDNEWNVTNASTMFMEGQCPMFTAGQWFADEFIRNAPADFEWGFVSWPIAEGGSSAAIYDCTGWASSKDISNPDLIYDMIKFIHTDMYSEVLPQTPVAPPAAVDYGKAYYDKLTESGHQDLVDGMTYMLESPTKLPVRFLDPFASDAGAFQTDAWGPIINGAGSEADLDKMVENTNNAITRYWSSH